LLCSDRCTILERIEFIVEEGKKEKEKEKERERTFLARRS
jgi:hypothetical protein